VFGTFVGTGISIWQARIAQTAAIAAKNAAETTQETLEISERAFIVMGNPTLSGSPVVINLPLTNTGSIPARFVRVIAYEETVTVTNQTIIEGHWGNLLPVEEIPPSSAGGMTITLTTTAHFANMSKIEHGKQAVVFAGKFEYSDGFPETPERTAWFCANTLWNPETRVYHLVPCDASVMISQIAKDIGYPSHYEGQTPIATNGKSVWLLQ
jgi:hypothetical protein